MKVRFTDRREGLRSSRCRGSKAFAKQLRFLLGSLNHPSLHAKKYDEAKDIWQARVNRSWRFYFMMQGDEHMVISIIPHPK